MDLDKIKNTYSWLYGLSAQLRNVILFENDCTNVKNDLIAISYDIEKIYPSISKEIFRLKDYLFVVPGPVNPVILGELIALLRFLCNSQGNNDFWDMVHPMVIKTSKKLFEDGHYANSAEDAFIEINARVKQLYKIINPTCEKVPDGDTVMTTMFSPNNPMIRFSDISTDTGKNIQKGYMQLFAGAISALRNPKAHENISLGSEECKQRLIFASMLMYKLDEGVKYTGVHEN